MDYTYKAHLAHPEDSRPLGSFGVEATLLPTHLYLPDEDTHFICSLDLVGSSGRNNAVSYCLTRILEEHMFAVNKIEF